MEVLIVKDKASVFKLTTFFGCKSSNLIPEIVTVRARDFPGYKQMSQNNDHKYFYYKYRVSPKNTFKLIFEILTELGRGVFRGKK